MGGANYVIPTLYRGVMLNTDLNDVDGGFATDRIVVSQTGVYKITAWADIKPQDNNTLISFQIGISGTPSAKSLQQLNIANKDEERLFCTTIFQNLNATDTVSMLFSQTGSALQNIAIGHAYISVQYLYPQ
jgi:hypothetical protein